MAANKFSFMDILNAQSKADTKVAAVTEYTEIYLNPYDVEGNRKQLLQSREYRRAGRRYTCRRTAAADSIRQNRRQI